MDINFFSEDIEFELSNTLVTQNWILQIIENSGFELISLNYIFCSDVYLHEINLRYLAHDTYTDIITFDHSEADNQVESDIFVSIERVKENSIQFNFSFEKELHRVMIHGVLHLMGNGDKTEEEKIIMRKKEDACLSLHPKFK